MHALHHSLPVEEEYEWCTDPHTVRAQANTVEYYYSLGNTNGFDRLEQGPKDAQVYGSGWDRTSVSQRDRMF